MYPDNNMPNTCGDACGTMPECAPLAVPYVPFQQTNPKRYSQQDALNNGTLFPGLNLPFRVKPDAAKVMGGALAELQALEFVLVELGLYLDTHQGDAEAFELYKQYAAMEKEAREKYEAMNGPVTQMATANAKTWAGWLSEPWPWNYQELGASLRYLSQRYSMPYPELKGLLTDIGTEELGHLEMIGAIVHQLTRNLNDEQVREGGFAPYFVDHTTGVYPTAASGFPWNAASMAVKGDVICDLSEDMAAEQKARVTYDNILRMSDDPDVNNVIRFLREREVVHFQRFGEAVRLAKEKMDQKNIYFTNPAFDK